VLLLFNDCIESRDSCDDIITLHSITPGYVDRLVAAMMIIMMVVCRGIETLNLIPVSWIRQTELKLEE